METPKIVGTCWNCGREMTAADFGRENDCVGCRKPTRVCRNCADFVPGRKDCLEARAERVLEPERSNFCEYFRPTLTPAGAAGNAGTTEDLRAAAERLFRTND